MTPSPWSCGQLRAFLDTVGFWRLLLHSPYGKDLLQTSGNLGNTIYVGFPLYKPPFRDKCHGDMQIQTFRILQDKPGNLMWICQDVVLQRHWQTEQRRKLRTEPRSQTPSLVPPQPLSLGICFRACDPLRAKETLAHFGGLRPFLNFHRARRGEQTTNIWQLRDARNLECSS